VLSNITQGKDLKNGDLETEEKKRDPLKTTTRENLNHRYVSFTGPGISPDYERVRKSRSGKKW